MGVTIGVWTSLNGSICGAAGIAWLRERPESGWGIRRCRMLFRSFLLKQEFLDELELFLGILKFTGLQVSAGSVFREFILQLQDPLPACLCFLFKLGNPHPARERLLLQSLGERIGFKCHLWSPW